MSRRTSKNPANAIKPIVVLPAVLTTPLAMPMTPRRRGNLNSSCAVAALLALPAAVSVGIMLARPAHAQTTIDNNTNATAILANYYLGNPFTITSGTTINAASGDGVYGNLGTNWTLTNYGVVMGGTANGVGFGSGGTIYNAASLGIQGTIIGANEGVYVTGTTGVVGNHGLISGTANDGVALLAGGTVTNYGVGIIDGLTNGISISGAAGSVVTSGSVEGTNAAGIVLTAGGNVYNTGSVGGGVVGVALGGAGSVVNYGQVISGGDGISISGGTGYVYNRGGDGSGYIYASNNGIAISSANGTVINAGVVKSSNALPSSAATIYLANGGTVNNSGSVESIYGIGVHVKDAAGTVLNSGLITAGFLDGVSLSAGGDVQNYSGGTISGLVGVAIDGGGAVNSTVVNSGLIAGAYDGVSLVNGSGTFGGGYGSLDRVINYGTIRQNFNGDTSNEAGVFLSGDGAVYNGATPGDGFGSIANAGALIQGTNYGVLSDIGTVGVENGGTIIGTAGSGVLLGGSGSLVNFGTVLGGLTGTTIEGNNSSVFNTSPGGIYGPAFISGSNDGVLLAGTMASVANFGTIVGFNDDDVPSGTGVSLAAGGMVVNATPGGVGAGLITGVDYGVHVSGGLGQVENDGYIFATGSSGTGVELSAGGYASNSSFGTIDGGAIGVGVDSGGSISSTVVNDGLIAGGRYGVSLANGPSGNGYLNSGTVNALINFGTVMQTGSSFIPTAGVVLSGDGAVYNGTSQAGFGTLNNDNTLALIQGDTYGVLANGGTAAVLNAGTIIGTAGSGVLLTGSGVVQSFGTILGGQTGITIEGTQSDVVNYSAGGLYGAAFISGSNDGVLLSGSAATMVNFGTVVGYNNNDGNPTGTGVSLSGGGGVLNFTNGTTGSALITGAEYGVHITGAPGGLFNSSDVIATNGNSTGAALSAGGYASNSSFGTIQGGAIGLAFGSYTGTLALNPSRVSNGGLISGGHYGVSMASSGYVNNQASGSIYGSITGVAITGGVMAGVSNAVGGTIAGRTGVYLNATANQLYNAGSIAGYLYGAVLHNGGTVYNSGLITADNSGEFTTGISLTQGGAVTNSASGLIYGYGSGINAYGAPVNVVNAGTILAPGESYSGDYVYKGIGVYSQVGGTLTNSAGGLIMARAAGVEAYGTMDVTNSGNIISTEGDAVSLDTGVLANDGLIQGGDTGVYVNSGSVTNSLGGTIVGTSYGVNMHGPNAGISNDGTIMATATYGTGIGLYAGGTVADTGVIAGGEYGVYVHENAGTVINSGTISEVNNGASTYAAVYLYGGGAVINQAGGTLLGASDGVIVSNGFGTITNAGLINGVGYDGVSLNHGGSVVNSFGGTILGAHIGVYTGYAGATVANSGLIIGTTGDAVSLYRGGSLTNFASGTITAGYSGVYIAGAGASVLNGGTITGSQTGVALSGVATVLNVGTALIAGATGVFDNAAAYIGNAGTILGTADTGVALTGGGTVNNIGDIGGFQYGVAISNATGTVMNSGAILQQNGTAAGGAAVQLGQGGYLGNTGVLAGRSGVMLMNNGIIENASGGLIIGYDFGINANGTAAITNGGSIIGTHYAGLDIGYGTVTNMQNATISGGDEGVSSYKANITNAGLINGANGDGVNAYQINVGNTSTGTISGQHDGVSIYMAASVANAGTIIGAGSLGIGLFHGGAVTNEAGGIISGYMTGVQANGPVTVDNAGLIAGNIGYGVDLQSGGTVINRTGASIYGGNIGVENSAAAAVLNAGVVSAYTNAVDLRAGGYVLNTSTGTITSTYDAILSRYGSIGSTIINAGQIMATGAYSGIRADNDVQVQNSGTISGGAYGVLFNNTGSLVNLANGVISGGGDGVNADDASITNAGHINGNNHGVAMYGGVLNNLAGGVIQGGAVGLYAYGAVISNAGLIEDNVTAGAQLGNNDTLTNLPNGTISGVSGLDFTGTNATVLNAGTIASTIPGGTAVSFAGGTAVNYLTLTTGSKLIGLVDGGGSGSQIALTGTGRIDNTIQNFGAGSGLDVQSGADWTATGNWTIANVTNEGTFQAGVLGTPLSLTGNFVQASLGTLRVVVTPTLSSQFIITGAAQLDGTLKYVFAPGYYAAHTYNFLTATDGVTGNFANVNYSGFVPPQLTHTTNNEVVNANLVLAGNGIVSPEDDAVFGDQSQAEATTAQQANSSLLGKAAEGSGAGSSAAAACAAEAGVMGRTDSASTMGTASRMASAVANAFCGAGGWIEATGTEMNADASGGAADYHADTGGFLAGIDKAVNEHGLRIGLAVGYDETWLHDGNGGKGTVDTTRVGIYGSQPIGRFTLAADFLYGHGDNTTNRATGIGQARAKYGSDIFSGAIQGSTAMALGAYAITPAAGLRIASVSAQGFAESGAGFVPFFAVNGKSSSYTSIQPFVNVGISRSFLTGAGIAVTPSASIGYDYEAGDRGKAANVAAADGTSFVTTYNRLDASTAVLAAGIAAGRNNWSLYAHYTADVSGNWTAQTAEAGLQVKF